MEPKNTSPTFEPIEYTICTRMIYVKNQEPVEDQVPKMESITISSREQLLDIIEKLGQYNRDQLYKGTIGDLTMVSEKKLMKL